MTHDWIVELNRNLSRLHEKNVIPELAPNPKEYIKELEARINQKDMEIDALRIENGELNDIVKINNLKIYEMRGRRA